MKTLEIAEAFVAGILGLIALMLVVRNPQGVNSVFEGLASLTEKTVSSFKT